MIASLPDTRQAPGFSVGQNLDVETASDYTSAHEVIPMSRTWGLEGHNLVHLTKSLRRAGASSHCGSAGRLKRELLGSKFEV